MLNYNQDLLQIHQTHQKQPAFQDTFQHPLCGLPSKTSQMGYGYQQLIVKSFNKVIHSINSCLKACVHFHVIIILRCLKK